MYIHYKFASGNLGCMCTE